MITKFKVTGKLGLLQGRGRKPLLNETAEEVAVVERAHGSQYSSTSAQAVPCGLSLSWSTVRKIRRSFVKWYPYKIHVVQALNPAGPYKRTQFARFFVENFGVRQGAFYPRRSSEYPELSHMRCWKS
ncbi:hypothetical protein AVEN_22398-1 [Araneus ventricosus]|uniref:DUF4817 domain-containing protein n=1 Tax=Araneus ventricosus TaxID=182803 RepID=A0A4Y2IIT1_ARAVE|nr:hypothetical protein AVEN_22398-1 [Araneus ventricosus]